MNILRKRFVAFYSKWHAWPPWQRRTAVIGLIIIAFMSAVYVVIFFGLPDAEAIKNYQPESTVTAEKIDWSLRAERPIRVWAPLKRISSLLQKAVVISEDDMFYQHNGVNFEMMREAFKVNWERKRYVRGASTITMQLARNAFLHKRKTLVRKIREIILARRIEKHLGKARILELYLNLVEWGENIYGAEAAARYYFGKSANALNLTEASLLAGMLPNPKYFDPYKRMKSCQRMQKRVLRLMQLSREVTAEQVQLAKASVVHLRGSAPLEVAAGIDSVEEAKYLIPALVDTMSPRESPPIFSDSLRLPDSSSGKDSLKTQLP